MTFTFDDAMRRAQRRPEPFQARIWFDHDGIPQHTQAWSDALEPVSFHESSVADWVERELHEMSTSDLYQQLGREFAEDKRWQIMLKGTISSYYSGAPGDEEWNSMLVVEFVDACEVPEDYWEARFGGGTELPVDNIPIV